MIVDYKFEFKPYPGYYSWPPLDSNNILSFNPFYSQYQSVLCLSALDLSCGYPILLFVLIVHACILPIVLTRRNLTLLNDTVIQLIINFIIYSMLETTTSNTHHNEFMSTVQTMGRDFGTQWDNVVGIHGWSNIQNTCSINWFKFPCGAIKMISGVECF